MISAQCVHRNTEHCDHKMTLSWLRDRYGAEFPVRNWCSLCMNEIYNSVALNLMPCIEELKALGILRYRISLTVEDRMESAEILRKASACLRGQSGRDKKQKGPDKWGQADGTRGHFKRGVE